MKFESTPHTIEALIEAGILEIGDGYRAKNSELCDNGLPFARVSNINDGFRFEAADRFPVENLHRVGTKVSRPGDVVFTSKGTVGRFAYVTDTIEQFVYSPQLCFWRSCDPEIVDSRFLYFWMQSPEFLSQVDYLKGQTDMADYVSLRDQRQMTMTLPTIGVQRHVAEVLGVLEDRISSIKETNHVYETIVRAIFRSWFVDFDPVKARAAGQVPDGIDEATAALFPCTFEDSRQGLIPKGWRHTSLGCLGTVVTGKTPPTSETSYYGRDIPFITIPDMHDNVFARYTARYLSHKGTASQPTKTLPPLTVCVSCIATPGLVALTAVPSQTNQQINSVVCGPIVSPYYLYCYMKHLRDHLITLGSGGSATLNVNKGEFEKLTVLVPPESVMSKFTEICSEMFSSILTNSERATVLAEVKNLVLPRLISGQLRIPEAQEALEEASH